MDDDDPHLKGTAHARGYEDGRFSGSLFVSGEDGGGNGHTEEREGEEEEGEDVTQERINAYFEQGLLGYGSLEGGDGLGDDGEQNGMNDGESIYIGGGTRDRTGVTRSAPMGDLPQGRRRATSSSGKVPPPSTHVATAALIRNLLPADATGRLPTLSGPFKLVRRFDRHGRLVSQELVANTPEALAGPVFVYAAHFDKASEGGGGNRASHSGVSETSSAAAPAADPMATIFGTAPSAPLDSPARLRPWKLLNTLRKDGKGRIRGPRKCGYCNRLDCRGRGGRQWCPFYRADRGESGGPRDLKRARVDDYTFDTSASDDSDKAIEHMFRVDGPSAFDTPNQDPSAYPTSSDSTSAFNTDPSNVEESVLSLIHSILPHADDDDATGPSDESSQKNLSALFFPQQQDKSNPEDDDLYQDPGAPPLTPSDDGSAET